ncbi:MAG: hypothetical protein LUF33_08575 [Clostridiales bacterium]|nr:hypothetical protein [Clostridiales bacterium]
MIFYICGWINKRYSEITNIKKLTKFSSKHLVSLTLAFVLLFVSGSFNHGIKELTSVDTFIAAITGTVNQYDYEYNEVLNVLESDDEVCEIDDIETVPDFFSSLGISESSDYWINQHLARYFDKEEVVLKSSEQ